MPRTEEQHGAKLWEAMQRIDDEVLATIALAAIQGLIPDPVDLGYALEFTRDFRKFVETLRPAPRCVKPKTPTGCRLADGHDGLCEGFKPVRRCAKQEVLLGCRLEEGHEDDCISITNVPAGNRRFA